MSDFNNYTEAALMRHMFGGALWIQSELSVGLWTIPLNDFSTGGSIGEVRKDEVDNYGYERVVTSTVGLSTDVWSLPLNGFIFNEDEIRFPQVVNGSWGTLVAVGLLDSSVRGIGNMIAYSNFAVPFDGVIGSIFRFKPGMLALELL